MDYLFYIFIGFLFVYLGWRYFAYRRASREAEKQLAGDKKTADELATTTDELRDGIKKSEELAEGIRRRESEVNSRITEAEKAICNLLKNTTKNVSQILLSGSIEGSNTKNEWSEIEEDNGLKGLTIKLSEGAQCDSERKHSTIFKLYCDDSIPDDQFENSLNFSEFNENGCAHYITGKSIYACALNDWYLLRKLMKEYNYIFATVFIIVGLFLTFWDLST